MRKLNQILFALLFAASSAFAQHPNLLLTSKDAEIIKTEYNKFGLFSKTFMKAKSELDEAMTQPMDVPYPKDAGGGYTHEKHKQNYNLMYTAGIMYKVTGEVKYAEFIRDMLDKYAVFYPDLPRHPEGKIETSGRLFWQTLNETVWLIHTIQAYDCIYDWLDPAERKKFETRIFIPMADFFLKECPEEFDRIHNHGTWMVTSVGMTGYVLHKKEYIDKALYGTELNGKGGFMKQLDELFSPDGYYTEGGYYVRYALWPFFLFAEAIANNQPETNIYEYRDQILKKAFYSALQMTYTNGAFMPINDALKEKTWLSPEIVLGLNFVYERYGQDKQLLSLVKLQNEVSLTGAGLLVAKDFQNTAEIPEFKWKSVEYRDGGDGQQGGVGILRYGDKSDMETLLFKYSAHGLSHGHFDKLTFLFYDQGEEIIQDYGAARFLNVEQKFGGRYLPENKSYALQTVAHNTVVVDEKSDFNGKQEESEKYHPDRYFFNASNPDFQYASAKDIHSYSGVKMQRTMVLVNDKVLYRPVVIDVFKLNSEKEHQYDLPFYYMGHLIYTSFPYTPFTTEKTIMGKKNGYQHLWKEATGKAQGSSVISWWNKRRFYSLISSVDSSMQIYLTRIGASDPNFNLRNEPGLMFRKKAKDFVFANVIEPHGEFDPTLEFTKDSSPTVEKVEVIYNDNDYTAVSISGRKDINWTLIICNNDADNSHKHSLKINGKEFNWTGPIILNK